MSTGAKQAPTFAAAQARENLRANIKALYNAGFTIIPLGGPDGKKPLVKGWDGRRRLPLSAVLNRLAANGSLSFGIRLDDLLVVDTDTDNLQTTKLIDERFGRSTVQVRTSRGLHQYFRCPAVGPIAIPRAIRDTDVAVDFKSGKNAYVVGPGSVRPAGTVYEQLIGDLATSELPAFIDRAAGPDAPTHRVPNGSRNRALVRFARQQVAVVGSLDALVAELMDFRNLEVEDPASVFDDEVLEVANWAWNLRLEGKLWRGRNSEVRINRLALDLLLPRDGGDVAIALYLLLVSEHGHLPGKLFAIVPTAIIKAGRMSTSRNKLYKARDTLLEEHLLELVHRGRGKKPHMYRLRSAIVADALSSVGEGERVSTFTLLPDVGHTPSS